METSCDLVGAWSEDLQCGLTRIEVVNEERMLFQFPSGHVCDMKGVISLARRINPKVKMIFTISGEFPDSSYVRKNGKWEFFDLRKKCACCRKRLPVAFHELLDEKKKERYLICKECYQAGIAMKTHERVEH